MCQLTGLTCNNIGGNGQFQFSSAIDVTSSSLGAVAMHPRPPIELAGNQGKIGGQQISLADEGGDWRAVAVGQARYMRYIRLAAMPLDW